MGIAKGIVLGAEGLGKITNGLGDITQATGKVAKIIIAETGETALELVRETKSVIQKIWKWIKEVAIKIIKFVEKILKATLDFVVSWFKNQNIKENEVAFSLTEKLRNGEYKVIQGIFSKTQEDVIASKQVDSQEIDDVLKKEEIILYS